MTLRLLLRASIVSLALGAVPADAATLKVLTTGAMKPVVTELAPLLEAQGHQLSIANDTAGALSKRIEDGEAFDLAVITPNALTALAAKGKVAGSLTTLARVGVGVMVKDGAPRPDISTVAAFTQALRAAKSVAYIDPDSGGSSGIYLVQLFDKLGITGEVKPKAKLKRGGYVADLVVSGEAELGLHQISEIVPVKGVTLVGALPREIQNYTTYAAAISANAQEPATARAFLAILSGPQAASLLTAKGMEPAR